MSPRFKSRHKTCNGHLELAPLIDGFGFLLDIFENSEV